MKYTELNSKAQKRARKDYLDGWNQTHDEKIAHNIIDELLTDLNDELVYDYNGKLIESEG